MQKATLYSFFHPYRWYIIAALLALIFTAGVTLTFGQGLRVLVDQGMVSGSLEQLNEKILLFLGIILLLGIGTYARYYIVSWLGERVGGDLRRAVFNHILYLPTEFFENNPVGDLHSRIVTDTTIIQQVIGGSLSIALRNLILLLGGLILLLTSNPHLTFIAFLLMPIVLLPILIYGRRVKRLSRQNQDQVAHLGAYLSESLQQIKTLQAFNHQPYDIKLFSEYVDNILKAAHRRIQQRAILIAFVIILVLCAVVTLLWFGGRSVLLGTLTPGELVAFLFYAILVAGSVGALSEVLTDLQRAHGAIERLLELLAVPDFNTETKFIAAANAPAKLVINNLSFHYPLRSETQVLQNINLTLHPGEHLALVGRSGAGKSTLFELLLGFYSVNANSIFFDNTDIKDFPVAELREQVAWVSQQPAIFSGTIWDNLRYGAPQAIASEIEAAAEAAHVVEFVQQLPNGYQTEVGENGLRLSGGQRQRIALARAFLRKPRLLLLDEPTSALDSQSEQMIQLALKKIMPSCTTIIIAHRLATVKAISQIAVLDKGILIALGSHEELMAKCPLYADLARLQMIS